MNSFVPQPLVKASALHKVYTTEAFCKMPPTKWANFYLYTCTRLAQAAKTYGGHGANMAPADCTAYLRKLGNELVRPLVNSTVATLNAPLSPGVLLLGQLQMHITTTFGINPL